mmetsp:Transcript_34904/g.100523  ORF Transcript_34904/g.100523 Transcript_34904/m.100523 type:complete len:244 (-) Transcript_34904:1118-1849(-)
MQRHTPPPRHRMPRGTQKPRASTVGAPSPRMSRCTQVQLQTSFPRSCHPFQSARSWRNARSPGPTRAPTSTLTDPSHETAPEQCHSRNRALREMTRRRGRSFHRGMSPRRSCCSMNHPSRLCRSTPPRQSAPPCPTGRQNRGRRRHHMLPTCPCLSRRECRTRSPQAWWSTEAKSRGSAPPSRRAAPRSRRRTRPEAATRPHPRGLQQQPPPRRATCAGCSSSNPPCGTVPAWTRSGTRRPCW